MAKPTAPTKRRMYIVLTLDTEFSADELQPVAERLAAQVSAQLAPTPVSVEVRESDDGDAETEEADDRAGPNVIG